MKSEVSVGKGCGWIRVSQEPGSNGTLVYLNRATTVNDVARDLLLPHGHTIWLQYGGDEPRPLRASEKPLQLQDDFLERIGYTDQSRRARLGIDPDLRYLISFNTGPRWTGRSGEVWLLKGLVLPQWKKKIITLSAGLMIIQSLEGGDWGKEAVLVEAVGTGDGPRGGRSVLKVTSQGHRSLYLGFDLPWQQRLWHSWLKQESGRREGDLSSKGLEAVPRGLGRLNSLDLSANRITSWDALEDLEGLQSITLASNHLTAVPQQLWSLQETLVTLDLSHNSLREIPRVDMPKLEELKLDGNLLESLPEGNFKALKLLSATDNRIASLPPFLVRQPMRALTLLDANEGEERVKPEDLKSINLRANLLKGNIILGNYGNLTQLDVSENSIECLDLTALDKLQSVQCSKNKLQDLSLNGTSLTSLIAGNNCLTKLSIYPKPTKLKHLDISYNRLETLPDWLGSCQHLRTLFASHNLLTSLPDHLFCSELSCLQTLQLSFNSLKSLPQVIRHIPLQQLFLQSNMLKELPEHFFLATARLRILNLSKNQLGELPTAIGDGHQLERLYLTCNQLTDIHILTKFTNLRVLHVAYNLITQLPNLCVGSWPDMEELVLSGNRIDRLPGNIAQWQHLRVLRLHCNILLACPSLAPSTSLKVLDLSHNNLDKVDLMSLVPKQLQFLDLSGNTRLQVDPRQFQDYKSMRKVSLVDVSGQNRDSLPAGPNDPKPDQEPSNSPWVLGFSETPGNREKLCISQLRLTNFCNTEALLGLFDSGNNTELPQILAQSIPRILLEERTVKETANEYMKYTLLAAHRELKEKGQRVGVCAMVCHICSERGPGIRKRTLRIATVGEAKAVLYRGDSTLTLAHVPTQVTRSQIGNSAMFPLVVPDPHVTELTLKDCDEMIIMANKRLWEVVSPEDAVAEVRSISDPVLSAKRLQDLAQSYGCEDNLSVMVVRLGGQSHQDQLLRELNYTIQESFRHPVIGCQMVRREAHCDGIHATENTCWCQGDRSSPSGQSDQASCGRTSSRENYGHYFTDKEIMERHSYPSVLMRENGTRKMCSKLAHQDAHLADCDESLSDRSGHLSDEQFRCWEYMLEQNTQMLFDKELDTLSRGVARRPARPQMWPRAKSSPHLNSDPSFLSRAFGSTRSFQSGLTKFGSQSSRRSLHAGPNAAYFGSLQRLLPYTADYDFSIIKERSEVDSLETEDRMSKYWDVATTEL
ncbi:protein phosphatase PHLPP-like protein isoform X2 [Cimex lectularius]|uniref:Leucine-rich repeat protein soc-2 homolog n=1 Tax=Cimex lectularius TaxID=79782 RepID=A0A8I6RY49_CIMLE|nr:protein phosphatase PHLPP-like protein isoform X2 [Cimex lectularius]